MDIIKRKHALQQGLPRYFTGKACKHGHIDERDAPSGRCIACIRGLSRKNYQENRESILDGLAERRRTDADFAKVCRERAVRQYHENRDAILERMKAAHRTEEFKAKRRIYYSENRDRVLAVVRSWRERNIERTRAADRRFQRRHPGRVNAKTAARLLHIKLATPPWADRIAIRAIYELASAAGMHVDHIVPLRSPMVCGLHCDANLQMLPGLENARKGNRHWPDMP